MQKETSVILRNCEGEKITQKKQTIMEELSLNKLLRQIVGNLELLKVEALNRCS
jgi:hypothetical protein